MPTFVPCICGICFAPMERGTEELHWKTHSRWQRFIYWLGDPRVTIGPFNLRVTRGGVFVWKRDKRYGINKTIYISKGWF